MTRDILIYNDGITSAQNLKRELTRSFQAPGFKVKNITIDDIRNAVLRDSRSGMLVCPGSLHEGSDYQKNFRQKELNEYHAFLNGGGVSLNICCGAYFATETISYVSPTADPVHYRSLHPVFNGRAQGPMYPYAIKGHPDSGSLQTSIAPVRFKNDLGEWKEACLSYANGPAFFPDNPDDPAMEILMTYQGMKHNPIAGLRLQVGKGSAYLIGPHPENGPTPFLDNGSPRLKAFRILNNTLEMHEEGRRELWTMLTNRIKNDLGYTP